MISIYIYISVNQIYFIIYLKIMSAPIIFRQFTFNISHTLQLLFKTLFACKTVMILISKFRCRTMLIIQVINMMALYVY